MNKIPQYLFFLILLLYPLFSFIVYEGSGIRPNNVLGLICLVFLILKLLTIYRDGDTLKIPNYIVVFGIFTLYTIISNILLSDEFVEEGAFKYFYSNTFLLTFIAFLVVENLNISSKWINIAIKILGVTLVFAAIVSVIQVMEPLFLIKGKNLIQGMSYDRIQEYYRLNPEEESGSISRFLAGYRLSIYSYINGLSVGLDALAIFSILLALKQNNWIKTGIWITAAALISFLSSARWIMLNFVIIVSQIIWVGKNKLWNSAKYGLYIIAMLLIMIPIIKYSGIDIQQFKQERLLSRSAYTRILAIEIFSEVYVDAPIFGTGGVDTPEMERLIRGRTSQIHVGYLKLFYYYGLVGGLLYLAFLATLMNRLWKVARKSDYWGGFFAFLAFVIANLTLVELDLFYHGLLLAIIFSNHFYFEKHKKISQS